MYLSVTLLAVYYLSAKEYKTFTSINEALEVPNKVYSLNLKRQKIARLTDSISVFLNLVELDLSENKLSEVFQNLKILKT